MRVDVEQIKAIQMLRKEINDKSLEELELYENGKRLDLDQQVLEEWRFTGLSNIDFIDDEIFRCKGTIYNVF